MSDGAAAGSPVGVTSPLKGIRRTAARQMVAAWQAPMFHLTVAVDMTIAMGIKSVSSSSTVTDVILVAVATALQEHPALNAHFGEGGVTVFEQVNVGLAVATDAGLTVPVIHDVPALGLNGVAKRRKEIVTRARAGSLAMPDVVGGTFTISNLGMLGIDSFDAIVNAPQVAILAVATTEKKYVWRGDGAVWRPMANFTLTCDHRAVDGATGSAFLARIREVMQSPLPTE